MYSPAGPTLVLTLKRSRRTDVRHDNDDYNDHRHRYPGLELMRLGGACVFRNGSVTVCAQSNRSNCNHEKDLEPRLRTWMHRHGFAPWLRHENSFQPHAVCSNTVMRTNNTLAGTTMMVWPYYKNNIFHHVQSLGGLFAAASGSRIISLNDTDRDDNNCTSGSNVVYSESKVNTMDRVLFMDYLTGVLDWSDGFLSSALMYVRDVHHKAQWHARSGAQLLLSEDIGDVLCFEGGNVCLFVLF